MFGVNKVMIIGHLGRDPDKMQTSSGQTITKFNVATSDQWKDKNGDMQERTEWHRVVVWSRLAEICAQYLSKGRMVYVEGRLQTRSWEDNQGVKKYSTDIVASNVIFLNSSDRSQVTTQTSDKTSSDNKSGATDSEPNFAPEYTEDIPF